MSARASHCKCPHCERSFADENARWQHARAKHGRKAAHDIRPAPAIDGEPSMGDLVVEAHWNPDPALDWARELFDVPHSGGDAA